jgi:hypothetical protein
MSLGGFLDNINHVDEMVMSADYEKRILSKRYIASL